MEVRVGELLREPALTAGAAGAGALRFAEQQLPEPERQALLPDSACPMEEQARG